MVDALPPIMSTAQWAELLGCSVKTLQERLRTGDLPGEKFGDDWVCPTEAMLQRINEIAVEKMMERRKQRTPAAVLRPSGKRTPPSLIDLR